LTILKNPSNDVPAFWKRWLLGWLPFAAVSAVVFQSAVLPPRDIPSFLSQINDKLIHGAEYFLLALAAIHAFRMAKSAFFREKSAMLALFYGSAMGVVTEISQLYVAGRACDFFDWLADFTGTVLALLLTGWVLKKKRNA